MINISKDELANMLVKENKVAQEQLEKLLPIARANHKTIFELLMEQDIVKEDDMMEFMSKKLDLPIIQLSSYKLPGNVLECIPTKVIEKNKILPLSRLSTMLTIATSNPFDLVLRDDIKGVTKCDVVMALATPKSIATCIDQYYNDQTNLDEIIEGIDEDSLEVIKTDEDEAEGTSATTDVADAPVVKMVNVILDGALKARASDIHFEPYEKKFRVRYRVDGALHESFSHGKDIYSAVVARMKIISNLDITEKRIPQDGRFRIRSSGKEVDFRVSILPTYYGEKIVLRVLDKAGLKSGLDQLGFTEGPTAKFAEAIKNPYGMILVTGPTGSGKSTSLYTLLGALNTPNRNIMTIEDPVEYQVEGITQTQVLSEVGMTFASGLRSLLRQSPDIVLVGEIRDGETADIAVKAALTGHLVFSTLHTNSAAGAVTRLIDMGVEPFLIASSCVCVAAQRLMKKVCTYCKEEIEISDEVLRRCDLSADELEGVKAYQGKGCAKCKETGYFGRIGTIEVMMVDNDIRELILQRKPSNVIHDLAVKKGMETLFENAFSIFKSGKTTLEEVIRVSSKE